MKKASTVFEFPVRESSVTAPDVTPRSCTWKTNAPEIGSESAEMARHATV